MFSMLKAWLTELGPSECSYKVCAKEGMRFAGEGTVPHGEESCSTALPALEFNELEPNLTRNWTTIMVSIYEQHVITNRCDIFSLQFGHFWAGTPSPSPHKVRLHSACMDVRSSKGAPAQYGTSVLFWPSLQKASLDAFRVFTCTLSHRRPFL